MKNTKKPLFRLLYCREEPVGPRPVGEDEADGQSRLIATIPHLYSPQNIYIYIYIKERCLSVCLFVCSDLAHKLLDGSQPNLAWATLWYMWVTSKYLFWGVDPPREGQNF